jgi:hypothetical protein
MKLTSKVVLLGWALLAGMGLAAATDCLALGNLGMALPADFVAFRSDSPWNVPIAANAPLSPVSGRMIAALLRTAGRLKADYRGWTIPIFVIDARFCPRVDVHGTSDALHPSVDPDGDKIARGIPIPGCIWPDPQVDHHLVLVDTRQRRSWEFAGFRASPFGYYASRVAVWDLDGPGFAAPFAGDRWWAIGANGAGMPFVAGVIRPEEIAAGEIRHALVCATPVNRKAADADTLEQLCNPTAARSDGTGVGLDYIPEGARLQLDPALNLDALGLSPAGKVIARALQTYGMYVCDNSPTFKLYLQNLGLDGGAWAQYNYFSELGVIPVQAFRVLDCTLAIKK